MFEPYRFDNLETDETHVYEGWSYCWAALFGPLYVLAKGFPALAIVMVLISCGIAALAFGILVFVVGTLDSAMSNVIATMSVLIAALALQGVSAIQLIRSAYLRRGWREWY